MKNHKIPIDDFHHGEITLSIPDLKMMCIFFPPLHLAMKLELVFEVLSKNTPKKQIKRKQKYNYLFCKRKNRMKRMKEYL